MLPYFSDQSELKSSARRPMQPPLLPNPRDQVPRSTGVFRQILDAACRPDKLRASQTHLSDDIRLPRALDNRLVLGSERALSALASSSESNLSSVIDFMSRDADRTAGQARPSLTMSDNSQTAPFPGQQSAQEQPGGSGRPLPASQQRAQTHASVAGQQIRRRSAARPHPVRHTVSSPSSTHAPENLAQLSHATPYTNNSPYIPSPPLYGSRPTYSRSPYSMPHGVNMMHSPAQYTYTHHPGVARPEANIPHMGYSSASLVPVMHAHLYPAYNASPDPGSNQSVPTYGGGTSGSLSVYTHLPSSSSPPLSPGSTQTAPHSAAFQSQPGFGYSAQYAFVPTTPYTHNPAVFAPSFAPSHYAQPYGSPTDQEGQGTWWYLPNTSTSQSFQSSYNANAPGHPRSGTSGEESGQQPAQPSSTQTLRVQTQTKDTLSHPRGSMEEGQESARVPTSPARSSPQLPAGANPTDALAPTIAADAGRVHPRRRQPYHPQPPAHRSEWVMWAGNVPSDATEGELREFFQAIPEGEPSLHAEAPQVSGGVLSIFLIARSNCAFVNFESEQHLAAAVAHFNGKPMRPNDPRCPRLVCRVRRPTDDLKAGVGGQRGNGMHTRWVKEQRSRILREGRSKPLSTSPEEEMSAPFSDLNISEDDGGKRPGFESTDTGSSDSIASTNSSFLTKHFPQRYFILKSLTQHDLDLSVQRGVWATQRHNEGVLDQAFRTSQDVFLIFGVNKSGEFYGYARMVSSIQHGGDRIPWESPPSSSSRHPSSKDAANVDAILSPGEHRFADMSPMQVSESQDSILGVPTLPSSSVKSHPPNITQIRQDVHAMSAPSAIGPRHKPLSYPSLAHGLSLDVQPVPSLPISATSIELDTTAVTSATVDRSILGHESSGERASHIHTHGTASNPAGSTRRPLPVPIQPDPSSDSSKEPSADDAWGRSFRVEWIHVARLPFFRTRHLRNPWNHGREVKVSRDGTELEPSVGKALLAEWERPPPSPSEVQNPPRTHQRRGTRQ